MADVTTHQLAEVDPGTAVVVQRVSDTDPEMLGYLEEIGLLPGVSVHIVEKAPFHGPITLLVNGDERVVGYRIASNVFVEQLAINN